jgi:hypothetical protein
MMDFEDQQPFESIVDPALITPALADISRIGEALKEWNADPTAFIASNFGDLVDFDFPLYAQGNLRIKDKSGRLIRFRFNRLQRQLWKWFLEDMAAGRPVRWFIIKARQMGVSTWILALFYWIVSLRPNRNALVLAHDEDSVENFSSTISTMWADSDPLLAPPVAAMNRALAHFGESNMKRKQGSGTGLDSKIIFQTAKKAQIGRSLNLHLVLMSEYAIYPEIEIDLKKLLVGLESAVAELPGTIVIKESTAQGENQAKDDWDDPTNGYRKIFASWVAYDDYSIPLEPGEEIILSGAEEIGGAGTRYGNEVEECRLIREQLHIWYDEAADPAWVDSQVLPRIKWRRYYIDKKCQGDKQLFRQEYPTIVAHAFSSTSRNCFDSGSLEQMRAYVEAEGLDVVRCNYIHDREEENPNRKFKAADYGKIQVYKTPEEGITYVIGVDISMGLSPSADPSALIVLATPDLEEVASFGGIIPPQQLAEIAYYLGKIYNCALLGVENNDRGGAVANTYLSYTLHYPRLYYHRDPFDKKAARIPGFVTTAKNKSASVADLAQAIRDHEILFRSKIILDQLAHYEEKEDGTMAGATGWKDDFVSAALIAIHLSTKIHQFPEPEKPILKGSFAEAAEQIARKNGRARGFGF